jgi:hypothetical protein
MYVIVDDGHIFSFGLTPKKAMDHFLDGLLSYDGPPLDTRPCSPALYRRLQALDRKGMPFVDCRINRDGVAVCRKDTPRTIVRRKDSSVDVVGRPPWLRAGGGSLLDSPDPPVTPLALR